MRYHSNIIDRLQDHLQREGERHTLDRYTVRQEKEMWSLRMDRRHNQTAVDVQQIFERYNPWVVEKLYTFQRNEKCVASYEFLAWDASEKRLAFAKCFLLPRLAPIRDLYIVPYGTRRNPILLLDIEPIEILERIGGYINVL